MSMSKSIRTSAIMLFSTSTTIPKKELKIVHLK